VRLPRNADHPYLTNIQLEDFSYLAPEDFARFAGSSMYLTLRNAEDVADNDRTVNGRQPNEDGCQDDM